MKTINIHCPLNTTSYGYVSSNMMQELHKLGYKIYHTPISQNSPDSTILPKLNSIINNRVFNENSVSLKIWHQNDLSTITDRGRVLGFPIFELETFDEIEKISLEYPDKLLVCSKWAKQVVVNNTKRDPNSIDVVPLGIDDEIFKASPMPNKTTTVFANFGKFEIRKGHDVLPEIFNAAFTVDDDVALIMMPHNFFLNQFETDQWVRSFKNTKLGDKIHFVNRVENQTMVYNIMEQVHCGIFPARAEGWNLEALELLATGRHLIITNCTGHTEFCNKNNSRLIEMTSGYERAYDAKFFNGLHQWRKIGKDEKEQMINHMREIHKLHQNGELKINLSGVNDSLNFTWRRSACEIDKIISNWS